MVPHLLQLLLERANIFPSDCILKLVEKQSTFAIPKFLDILIELSYGSVPVNQSLHDEAESLLEKLTISPISFEILRHLFSLQGPPQSLPEYKQIALDDLIRRISSKKGGLRHLMLTLMDLIGTERNQKLANTIAMCICKPPHSGVDHDEHYRQLSAQIIDLLQVSNVNKIMHMKENEEHNEYLRFSYCVALECVHLCSRFNKQYAQNFLLDVLFADFYRITDDDLLSKIDESTITVVESSRLLDSLTLASSLLSVPVPSQYVQKVLRCFSELFRRVSVTSGRGDSVGVCRHRLVATEIVSRLVDLLPGNDAAVVFVERLLGIRHGAEKAEKAVNGRLRVRPGLDGESFDVVLVDRPVTIDDEDEGAGEAVYRWVLVDVFGALSAAAGREAVQGALFMRLLKARLARDEQGSAVDGVRCCEVLAVLCSQIDATCFKRKEDIITIVKTVIVRPSCSEATLECALSMLVLVLEAGPLADTEKTVLSSMMAALDDIRLCHPNESTRDLATDIAIVVATRGHVSFLACPPVTQTAPLVQEVAPPVAMSAALRECLEEIDSAEPALMGHGLMVLSKLIGHSTDASVAAHREHLFSLLVRVVCHEDSFVYQRAVTCMAALGTRYTARVLPVVAQRLRAMRAPRHVLLRGVDGAGAGGGLASRCAPVCDWLRMSEALNRMVGDLGETAPMFLDVVLSSILSTLGDPDDLVRASSLSTLGRLSTQCTHLLVAVVHEIAQTVCRALLEDRSPVVRRAASHCIQGLLLGPHGVARADIMTLYPGEVLLHVYRSIRHSLDTETDPEVVRHVSATFHSLDDCMRLFAFPAATTLTPSPGFRLPPL